MPNQASNSKRSPKPRRTSLLHLVDSALKQDDVCVGCCGMPHWTLLRPPIWQPISIFAIFKRPPFSLIKSEYTSAASASDLQLPFLPAAELLIVGNVFSPSGSRWIARPKLQLPFLDPPAEIVGCHKQSLPPLLSFFYSLLSKNSASFTDSQSNICCFGLLRIVRGA